MESTIIDETPSDIDGRIAVRLQALRQSQGLSLAALAERSGVSKAMISRIERAESSASAALLGKLAAALGVSLAALLAEPQTAPSALRRRAEQEVWRDPVAGYTRRQVATRDETGVELVEVALARRTRISYPPWGSAPYRQRLWLLEGTLAVRYGDEALELAPGDCLTFAVDRPLVFQSAASSGCRYLLAIVNGPG